MSLFDGQEMTATFVPGKSALGHHWELTELDGNTVGDTKREYGGGAGKRGLLRLVTATGLDSGRAIRALLRDKHEQVVAHLLSDTDEKTLNVTVTDPSGGLIGVSRRTPKVGFAFEDASGTVIARMPRETDQPDPWTLLDAADAPLGAVTRQEAIRIRGATFTGELMGWNNDYSDGARDFQNTMHLGFAFSNTYSVALTDPPTHPLIALTPVLLAYSY